MPFSEQSLFLANCLPLSHPPRPRRERTRKANFQTGSSMGHSRLQSHPKTHFMQQCPVFYADPSAATTGNDDNTFGVADGARGSSVDHQEPLTSRFCSGVLHTSCAFAFHRFCASGSFDPCRTFTTVGLLADCLRSRTT